MTDRGRTSMEGPPACPFIAYEDDRDERSAEPDHAHRCYAEVRPATRALAHQEAYCLSSAFPVCPTFQGWARREAAQARSAAAASNAGAANAITAGVAGVVASSEDVSSADDRSGAGAPESVEPRQQSWSDQDEDEPVQPAPDEDDPQVSRNPPRDWAAPPPWAGGSAGAAGVAASRSASSGEPPDFLASRSSEGRGLAGSAADRLAGGPPPADVRSTATTAPSNAPSAPADPELAGLVGLVGLTARPTWSSGAGIEPPPPLPPARPGKRPAVSSTRDRNSERSTDGAQVQAGPAWEKARRYEAYPTIKTRTGMPDVPRVLVLAGALGLAALALFFLPALLGLGGKDAGGPAASAGGSVAIETTSPSPTIAAAPTPQVYVVKSGDNMTKIAKSFGLTVEQVMTANPTLKDPNKIAIGDQIIIPTPPPDVVTDPSAAPSP